MVMQRVRCQDTCNETSTPKQTVIYVPKDGCEKEWCCTDIVQMLTCWIPWRCIFSWGTWSSGLIAEGRRKMKLQCAVHLIHYLESVLPQSAGCTFSEINESSSCNGSQEEAYCYRSWSLALLASPNCTQVPMQACYKTVFNRVWFIAVDRTNAGFTWGCNWSAESAASGGLLSSFPSLLLFGHRAVGLNCLTMNSCVDYMMPNLERQYITGITTESRHAIWPLLTKARMLYQLQRSDKHPRIWFRW